jgi:uncharacterized protein (DUF362 family)
LSRQLNLSLACFFAAVASVFGENSAPSVVYSIHDPAAIDHYRTDARAVHVMVDRLLLAVTHQPDVAKAWASLVQPADKIGIKISAVGGELFTTHRDVVNAIVDGLVAAGHARGDIVVWDRTLGGIKEAGYRAADGYQVKSIFPGDGYDAKAVYSAPVLGQLIWGDSEYRGGPGESPILSDTENTSTISHFSRIVAREVTKVINVPVFCNSERNGIAGCLYNMTIPNVDNWRRFTQPPEFGASSIAEMYADPAIGKKVVLNVMDGLLAEYGGGPQAQPNYALHFATLYASKDPVAIDAVALGHLAEWRARRKLGSIESMGAHVKIASELGLGNSAPGKIEVRDVGR